MAANLAASASASACSAAISSAVIPILSVTVFDHPEYNANVSLSDLIRNDHTVPLGFSPSSNE